MCMMPWEKVLTFIIVDRCEIAQDNIIKVQKPPFRIAVREPSSAEHGAARPLCLWDSSKSTVCHPQWLLRIHG